MPELTENAPQQEQQSSQTQTPTQEAHPTLTPEQIEFQGNMALAFDDVSLIPKVEENNNGTPLPEISPEIQPAPLAPPAQQSNEEIIDANAYLKEQLGWDDWETAKAELAKLKSNSPAKETEYPNDITKKIVNNLKAGNIKEVTAYLKAQELLEDSESMSNEQKLKLYIKMQNPKFDKELIEDEYNSLYTLSEDSLVELEPLAQRKARLKLEQRLDDDVVKAQEYFTQYSQKIQLSDIQPQTQTTTVDEDYEDYKASNAKANEIRDNLVIPGIKALKESDVQLGFKVEDSNNQMNFDVAITPTPEQFEKARQDSLSFNQFLTKTYYDKDGKFLPQQLQRMILLTQNFDNYAQSIARQAVNEERKRVIAKEAPNGSNGNRDYNVNPERTELQKQMDFALS